MGKKIAVGLIALLAILAAVVAMQPSRFTVERSTVIQAPAAVVYPHIQSLRAMDAWSPWVKMDPEVEITHTGPEAGVGAVESWNGPQIGAGQMTITAVKPDREVEIRLEFTKPMPATNHALFTLAPAGDATRVTWHMDGANNFVGKALSLVMSMDRMVGGPFEQGLAALKSIAESEASGLAAAQPE